MQGIRQWWQSQTRLCHNECHQRSVQHITIAYVCNFKSSGGLFKQWHGSCQWMHGDGKWLTIPVAPWWPTWMLHPQRSYSSFDVCANQQARTIVERNNAPVTKMDWECLRCLMACNECCGQSCNNTDMTMNLDVDDDDHHHDEDAEGNLNVWKGHQMTASPMVCYRWIHASYVIMLSYFQVAKKLLLHLCPAAGYLA